ncbi:MULTISPECIES: HD-GYP domain-containing protein [unclassified Bacillus (in: firmicutes)]|uniref:HD-GYP domain-containing protein n=1 Tax=unclassified Bacillus (in: firmicutes) TaxID=185979 RepID=UPI0008EF9B55|nr:MULTISPECIES: HD domain-containing phosphohydrolase [unclassified Bacillus (in: firmicutes)]SFB08818.1 HD domain-containing protein [Bacillus sp. UNCCL13]SFQ86946.1 HD domain-containing protein [Bacillus sp. cl95]
MRLISIDEYRMKTMQLARPVVDKQRRVLLAAGRSIHPAYLKRLEQMGIRYLFVEDAVSFGISLEEMVDMPTWIDAIQTVQAAYQTVMTAKTEFPLRELQRLVVKLLDEVSKRKAIVLIPASSLAEELREAAHCVNVTLLSLQLAKKMNLPQLQVKDLALGTLVHDIGRIIVGNGEDHPQAGFDFLRRQRELSLLSAHVAFQHHERADGSGYPRGLDQSQIHEFAQICAISNTFDQLLSDENMPPHEAMEWIMTQSGKMFTTDLVQLFVQEVPPYTPGTKVMINNGRMAIVTKIKSNVQRPYIRYLDTNEEISLAENHTMLITSVLVEEKEKTDQ